MQSMLLLAIIAFIFIFLQAAMNLLQYRGIQKQYGELRGHCHYVSVGQLRKFGRVRIALLGFGINGALEECWLLNGITFFARFKRITKYDGTPCGDLAALLDEKNKGQACILQAAGYMQMRLDNHESDEEYFALAKGGENASENLTTLPDPAR